jgi:DegV family protein with EDD domain
MKKVVVVTDSSANLPAKLVDALGIRIVPIVLAINGHTFYDGVDITPTEVYHLQRESRDLPKTAAPSIGDFLRIYTAASPEASGIVSIHMSPKLSATHDTALAASELVEDVPVRVIDSHSAAMAQGFVVLEAARAAAQGASLDEVVARADEMSAKVQLLAMVGTLEYLRRGGRIGGAAALLGTVLQIKPVLLVDDGQVDVLTRPRTKSKAVQIMLEELDHRVDSHKVHAAVLHAAVPEDAAELRGEVERRFECSELYVTELTPIMGAHTGPGVLGVAFYAD